MHFYVDPVMPLLSFSVDAYDKARARLKELAASRKAGAAQMDSPNKAEVDLSDNEEQEEAKGQNVGVWKTDVCLL